MHIWIHVVASALVVLLWACAAPPAPVDPAPAALAPVPDFLNNHYDDPRSRWIALTTTPQCKSARDKLQSLLRDVPQHRTHVYGAWMLCALESGSFGTAATIGDRILSTDADDWWRAGAQWSKILGLPATAAVSLPAELPEYVGAHILRAAIARAQQVPVPDWSNELFQRFPGDLGWTDDFRRQALAALTRDQRWALAIRLASGGHNPTAFEVLEHLWTESGVADPVGEWSDWTTDPGAAELIWFADTAFAARQYRLAAAAGQSAFESGSGHGLLVWGRSLARLGQGGQATAVWRQHLATVKGTSVEPRILYRLGLLAEDRNDAGSAEGWYQLAATLPVVSGDRDDAGFRSGWLPYRRGDLSTAYTRFAYEQETAQGIVETRRAAYWAAMAATSSTERIQLLRILREDAPLGYYGWLAAIAMGRPVTEGVHWMSLAGTEVTEAQAAVFGKVDQMGRLGLQLPALASLWQGWPGDSDAYRLGLLRAAQALDDVSGSLTYFWSRYESLFRSEAPSYFRDLWDIVYPRPYGALVAEAAQRFNVDPLLIYAIMREESRFRADVVSPAGAIGLLQLMPGTALLVSRRTGLPYGGPADLSRPEINVPLGTAYIASLLVEYRQNKFRAIAAYNAGPRAVDRWVTRFGEAFPADAWVEEIPYLETRKYVGKVLRSFVRYHALAGQSPAQAALPGVPVVSALGDRP